MRESIHRPVLLNETIEGLNLREGQIVLDGTFGGGGHALEICKRYKDIKIIALDSDQSAWLRSKNKFQGCDVSFYQANFRDLDGVLAKEAIGKVHRVLFDLGLSSDQLSPPAGGSGRGFSFMHNEPLFMTMKDNPSPEDLTARYVVNNWSEQSLSDIIRGYGEERYAKRIANGVVEARKSRQIETTRELVQIIERSVPAQYRRGRIHFATRTFQALRIAVNDELGALKEGLEKGFEALGSDGRMAVISFHSLEDRIVKRFYKEKVKSGGAQLINKKPVTASFEEKRENIRSRSAKLRILLKT